MKTKLHINFSISGQWSQYGEQDAQLCPHPLEIEFESSNINKFFWLIGAIMELVEECKTKSL